MGLRTHSQALESILTAKLELSSLLAFSRFVVYKYLYGGRMPRL